MEKERPSENIENSKFKEALELLKNTGLGDDLIKIAAEHWGQIKATDTQNADAVESRPYNHPEES